jgi:uncharacterized membrane protein YccF (DUF307 family)
MPATSDEIKQLIRDGKIAQAKAELRQINHPKAAQWLEQLNERYPDGGDSGPEKPKNMLSPEEKMTRARALAKTGQYDEARSLLYTLGDDPNAQRLLVKLDDLELAGPSAGNSTTVIVNQANDGPGCLVQGLWFIFFGWWLGQLWIGLAWFFNLTIIGLPVGLAMINRISGIVALRPSTYKLNTQVTTVNGQTLVETGLKAKQHPFILRALWFIFFGWWLSGIWMQIAYFLCIIIIGMPLGFAMFDRTASVLTLRK